jgi:anti-sigma B factor antagonist
VELSLKTQEADGNVVVLNVSGKLSAGEPVLLLRNTIQQKLEEGSRKFLIDLSNISYIDSSGLGALITTFTSVRNRQGDAKLLHLTKKIRDLLQITKLLTVFEVFDDETKAMQSFKI